MHILALGEELARPLGGDASSAAIPASAAAATDAGAARVAAAAAAAAEAVGGALLRAGISNWTDAVHLLKAYLHARDSFKSPHSKSYIRQVN